jgi:hypothetical protein
MTDQPVRPMLAAVIVLLPLLAACYTYAPVETGAVQPGMGVRARVSAAAGERIAPLLGTTDARLLNGTLISSACDTMIVEVPTVAHADEGSYARTLNQRVSIFRGDVLELESRKLDRFRTGALVTGAAVIVGAITVKSLKGQPGKENLPGGTGTDALIPLFRWHP